MASPIPQSTKKLYIKYKNLLEKSQELTVSITKNSTWPLNLYQLKFNSQSFYNKKKFFLT